MSGKVIQGFVVLLMLLMFEGCAAKPKLTQQQAISIARPFVAAKAGKYARGYQPLPFACFDKKSRSWSVMFNYGGMKGEYYAIVDAYIMAVVEDATAKVFLFEQSGAVIYNDAIGFDDPERYMTLDEFRRALAKQRARR